MPGFGVLVSSKQISRATLFVAGVTLKSKPETLVGPTRWLACSSRPQVKLEALLLSRPLPAFSLSHPSRSSRPPPSMISRTYFSNISNSAPRQTPGFLRPIFYNNNNNRNNNVVVWSYYCIYMLVLLLAAFQQRVLLKKNGWHGHRYYFCVPGHVLCSSTDGRACSIKT